MRTPWHLWVVGFLSLLWNAGGVFDYLMTQLGNDAYLSMMTQEQRAFMDARPVWFDAVWAIGVWGALAGSLLLLFRLRFATIAFGLSILGLILSAVWSFIIATPSAIEVMGSFSLLFSGAILISLILLFLYSRAMAARGVLM